MQQVINLFVPLDTTECAECGIAFAIPRSMLKRLRNNGKDFFCPSGHCLAFKESELERVRKKLDEQTRIASKMLARATASEKAEKESLLKINQMNQRSAAGLCPCCNRTFQQLARHMKSKHPSHK